MPDGWTKAVQAKFFRDAAAASERRKKIAHGFNLGSPAKTGKAPQGRQKGANKDAFSSVPAGLDLI